MTWCAFLVILYCGVACGLPLVYVSDGQFYREGIDSIWTPFGADYIDTGGVYPDLYHTTFNTDNFNPAQCDQDLAILSEAGYNCVRVFLDTGSEARTTGANGNATDQLNPAYLQNLATFVTIAGKIEMYVMITFERTPVNNYFSDLLAGASPDIQGINVYWLDDAGVQAKIAYVTLTLQGLQALIPDLSPIFAVSLENEAYFDGSLLPFNTLSLNLTTSNNGLTYDMSDAGQRQQCADANAVNFAIRCADAVRATAPGILVTVGMFTFEAVGKSGPQGLLPIPTPSQDARFPFRPAALNIYSNLDYLDVHIYPDSSTWTLQNTLDTEEWFSGVFDFTRIPVVMGEYGAFTFVYADLATAQLAMLMLQTESCQYNFVGWLYWTFNTTQQDPILFNLMSNNGALLQSMSPLNRSICS